MKKWKYLKGSEKDFDGAPDWATIRERFHDSREFFVERHDKGGKYQNAIHSGSLVSKFPYSNPTVGDLIAMREPATNDEQDINDCIGAPEADATEQLITERGSRYGKFKDGAEIMQELKDVMREVDGWRNLTPSQREALDMIQHKIGRILNGDPTYDDSWKDIAGYATLIVNELNGEIK